METIETSLKQLPHTTGVYIFKDRDGTVVYVGKAVDLSRRVKQYFSGDDALGEKTRHLVPLIASLATIKTDSEFDALLLEAQLIRLYNPKYNSIAKDDKSPLYIALTLDERLPRVLFLRKTQLWPGPLQGRAIFGPFQSSRTARMLLSTLRFIVPYCTQKQRNGKACFYTHLGLCKPCPSYVEKLPDSQEKKELIRQYRRNMIRLKEILAGKGVEVRRSLEHDMQKLAHENKFEEASALKRQIEELYQLQSRKFDPVFYLTQTSLMEDTHQNELEALRAILLPDFPAIKSLQRIECIDISHTGFSQASGSLVVLSHGIVDKSQYRKFHIRTVKAPNDVAMIAEVVTRRLRHPEWPYPDLFIIDGGKGQVHAAVAVLKANRLAIPVIGLAKRFEEIIVPLGTKPVEGDIPSVTTMVGDHETIAKAPLQFRVVRLPLTNPAMRLMQRIRDEAHRFAKNYQIHLRKHLLQ